MKIGASMNLTVSISIMNADINIKNNTIVEITTSKYAFKYFINFSIYYNHKGDKTFCNSFGTLCWVHKIGYILRGLGSFVPYKAEKSANDIGFFGVFVFIVKMRLNSELFWNEYFWVFFRIPTFF